MDKIENSPEIIFRGICITFMYLESFAIVLLYQKIMVISCYPGDN